MVSKKRRKDREVGGPQRRSISIGELRNILANMPAPQRNALLRMFPLPEPEKKFPEKITRRELLALWTALEALMDTPSHAVEFAYAIVQNRNKLAPTVEELEKAKEPSDEWRAFDGERLAVCHEFASKDGEGAPVHDGVSFKIPPDKLEAFEARAAEVREKHAEAIEDYKGRAARYDELLASDIPCPKFVRVPMRALPPGLTARQLEPLQIILE